MDISNGFITDTGYIAEMSKVDIDIYKQKIPVLGKIQFFCKEYNLLIDNFTLGSGEKYQLLVTVSEKMEKV